MAKKTTNSNKVSRDKTCGTCAFYDVPSGYCKKRNEATRPLLYACGLFMTPEEWTAYVEQRKAERLRQEEHRLNFILTGLYIMSTATMQMLEHFDAQFSDKKVESNWRFQRKRAANEIDRCVQRIRDLWQHNFMADQTQVLTAHGTQAFDAESYDNHDEDARRWCKLLLHHMETTWQDDNKETEVLAYYESLPRVGIFTDKDFRHFTTKR